MHGCGNDYIYINGFEEKIDDLPRLAVKMSNRHFGIGGDGIVIIMPSKIADFKMRMFNSDGSEAEMCGNATRCIAKYVYDYGLTNKETITLETLAGVRKLILTLENGSVKYVCVDMGIPILDPKKIPVLSSEARAIYEKINANGKEMVFTCVSMGNPHAVTFVSDIEKYDVKGIGQIIEKHPKFPRKTNTEFVEIINDEELKMRVWERGAGETLACGTGACAALVAAFLTGKSKRKARILLLGGCLIVEWDEKTNHVFMQGPAEKVFEGIW